MSIHDFFERRAGYAYTFGIVVLLFVGWVLYLMHGRGDDLPVREMQVALGDGERRVFTTDDVRELVAKVDEQQSEIDRLAVALERAERAERRALTRAAEAEFSIGAADRNDGRRNAGTSTGADGESGAEDDHARANEGGEDSPKDALSATDWKRVSRAVAARVNARSKGIGHVEAAELRKEFGYLESQLRKIAEEKELPGPADAVVLPDVAERLLSETLPELMPETAPGDRDAILKQILASTASALAGLPRPISPMEHQLVRLRAALDVADAQRGRVNDGELRNAMTAWLESTFNRSTSISQSSGDLDGVADGVASDWARRLGRHREDRESLLPAARDFVTAVDRLRAESLARIGEERTGQVYEALRGEGAERLDDWIAQLRTASGLVAEHARTERALAASLEEIEARRLLESGLSLWLFEVER